MRQLNRCKQRMMDVLKKRGLRLSSKKARIGSTEKGFHFLGINYPGTQPRDNTTVTQANVSSSKTCECAHSLTLLGGGRHLNKHCLRQIASFRIRERCVLSVA